MIRALVEQTFDSTKKYYVLAGLSTDSKPTSGVITGSKFLEVDTGVNYAFDEVNNQWTAFTITEQEIKDEIDAWLDDHPEATTTVEDGAISYAKLNAELKGKVDDIGTNTEAIAQLESGKADKEAIEQLESEKADKDGSYIDLTAGNAEFLLSDRGDTDITPYVFRKTGGAKKAYNREMLKKIVGGTVAWNQLAQRITTGSTVNGVVVEIKTDGSIRLHGTASADSVIGLSTGIKQKADHVYFFECANIKSNDNTFGVRYSKNGGNYTAFSGYVIFKATNNSSYTSLNAYIKSGTNVDVTTNPQVFDLTQMFGSTIANAIYAMEQATAGSGVAFFRSLFPKDYYAYNAGTLMSVQAKEHRTVGFNQWDEQWESGSINASSGSKVNDNTAIRSKNFISVISGETYYISPKVVKGNFRVSFYDYEKNYIGQDNGWKAISAGGGSFTVTGNTCFIRFFQNDATSYDGICINISNSSKNGTYEPYDGHVYQLDSDLELRGIPKLDSDGNLYYDGDEYTPNGTVKRKYGIVDLGTLSWSKQSAGASYMYGYFNTTIPTMKVRTTNALCTKYQITNVWNIDKRFRISSSEHKLYIIDSDYNSGTESAFQTAMSGVYLVYELATPTTETADPYHEIQICSRYGTEEFVDAGVTASTPTRDVSIPVGTDTFYPVNVFDYIEELTQPDHDMVADTNIASGKYFMVGNSLYLSTEAIEQGAAIVPGTNCTAVSLAEALNTINT